MLALSFFYNYIFSKRAGALVKMLAWVSIAGIALGLAALILVLSIMSGMHANIHERIAGIEPHIMWSLKGAAGVDDLKNSLAYQETFAQLQGIERRGYYERHDVIVRTMDGVFRGVQARGWDATTWNTMRETLAEHKNTGKNEFIDWLDAPLPEPGEIYMGYDLARVLGIIEGDPVQLIPPEGILLPPGEVPEIETVIVKKIIMTSLQDVDERQIYYRRGRTLRRFLDSPSREFGMELWLSDPFQVDMLASELALAGAVVSTWKERNSSLFFALSVEKTAMGVFLALSALISSFSIVIVLTLLLSQKKSDVAILMTMGLDASRAQRVFAGVGLILSSIGLLCGVLLGSMGAVFLQLYPIDLLPPDIYYDSQLPSRFDPRVALAITFVAFLVAFLSSWVPVRFLARLRPVEILVRS